MRTPVIPTGTYIFYESFERMLSLLTPDDELTVRRAISAYVFGKELPKMSDQACIAFEAIAPQLDANQKKRENGKKGGRPRKETMVPDNTEPRLQQSLNHGYAETKTSGYENAKTTHTPKIKPNVNVNVNVNANENVNESTPQTPQGASASDRAEDSPVPDPDPKPDNNQPKSPLSQTQQERFSRFWAAYPKKVSKGQAIKAWQKLKPSDDLTDIIISGINRAKQHDDRFIRDGGRFIPNPATWLNGCEWENEYADTHPSGSGGFLRNGREDIYTDWSEEIAAMEAASQENNTGPPDNSPD